MSEAVAPEGPEGPEGTPDSEAARAATVELEPSEIRRYGRHLVLPEVGMEGQKKLKAARVLLIGAGGLGSPAAMYLAAAGVGTLGIVDFDHVDESNLQRQVLYTAGDVGLPKAAVARERLLASNPHIEVVAHETRLEASNALQLISAYDLVVDGSDNFGTRYLVNDACLLAGRPLVWGAVLRFDGQVSFFCLPDGPCYRCLFPEPPPAGTVPSCAEGGVFGVLPGIIGGLQANEAIKWIIGRGDLLRGRFLTFDALKLRFREIILRKNAACPACGEGAVPRLQEHAATCATEFQEEAVSDSYPFEIKVEQLHAWREEGTDHVLVDVREPHEKEICEISGAALVPLREVPQRFSEFDKDRVLVVHCHHGGRSAHAVQFLRAQGFSKAINLGGGIEAWSTRIDSSVARY